MDDTKIDGQQNDELPQGQDLDQGQPDDQDQTAADAGEGSAEGEGSSTVEKAIDSLGIAVEEDAAVKPEEGKAAGSNEGHETDGGQQGSQQQTGQQQTATAQQIKKTPEQEDSDILKSIPSERGRARIGELLREGREAQAGLTAFRRAVSDSGLDQESFANMMAISKLCSSSNPADVEKGVAMFEQVREELYRQLGKEAPGVDLLANYKDLNDRVNKMDMRREDALAIANARKIQEEHQAQLRQAQIVQQEEQAFRAKMQTFQVETAKAFESRQNDIDFNAKIEVLKGYFTPQRIQEFALKVPPERWMETLLYMYDNTTPATKRAAVGRTISGVATRRTGVRSGTVHPGTPEGIAARIDEMGL